MLSATPEIASPSANRLSLKEEDDADEPHFSDNEELTPRINSPLQKLLQRRVYLNLAGKVRLLPVQSGHGGYSDIFIGYRMLPDGSEYKVAVKKLRAHIVKEGRKFEKTLAKELYIWSKLNHPRILSLEGFYVEEKYPYLISKWVDNGTIMEYLAKYPDANVLSLITGVAEGIQYLHSLEIIHSDIKPENVLISDLGKPLLCDFGVSRLLEAPKTSQIGTTVTSGAGGTTRYMSKEMLDESGGCSKQSDVWAFGMTIYTLLTRQAPYHDIKSDGQVVSAIIKVPSSFVRVLLEGRINEAIHRRPGLGIMVFKACAGAWYFKACAEARSFKHDEEERARSWQLDIRMPLVEMLRRMHTFRAEDDCRSMIPATEDSMRADRARVILSEEMVKPMHIGLKAPFDPRVEVGEQVINLAQTRRVILEALASLISDNVTHTVALDLLIVLDTTISMSDYIDGAKQSIVEICNVLRASGRLKQEDGLRVGFVAYRDYPEADNGFVFKPYDFTGDLSVVEEYLVPLEPYGGGDLPEAFSTALDFAYNEMEGWREDALKAIVIITDAAPHGIKEAGDSYPTGTPDGVSVTDPLQLAKDMAEAGYSIFTLACEPQLGKTTKYAIDFYRAISDRTLGRFCCLTDHRMLPAYIIGALLEKIDLRVLSVQYQDRIRKQILDEDMFIEQVVHDLHEELQSKSQKVTNMRTGDIYKDLPDANENYITFMKSRSLLEARTRLKDVNTPRVSVKDLKILQRYKHELDNVNELFKVTVRFRNMEGMGSGRIILQIFDKRNRVMFMYPDDVVAGGRPIEKKFKLYAMVNFTLTFGRRTMTFCRVFVDDTTIDVDSLFV